MMDYHIIATDELKNDPEKFCALNDAGQLRIHPASFWQQFSQPEIAAFCVRHGIYSIPTTELVEWLQDRIGQRKAIEVGAGNGVLADRLGIMATDNRMQEWAVVQSHYKDVQQATVPYGPNIIEIDAEAAVKKYQPEVVVAAWVTHKYELKAHFREGNQWGVKEERIISRAEYIHIGNRYVHRMKPILDQPHEEFEFPWLLSRAINGAPNFIAVWRKG
jgi:hypothetical protein